MDTTQQITTAEQLLEAGDIGPCELVRGELIRTAYAGYSHGTLVMRISAPLDVHMKERRLGEVTTAETGFVLERNPDTVRAPDVGFVRAGRLPAAGETGFFEGAPDLAAEVLSPSDRAGGVMAKVRDWLDAGCSLLWVVDPENRIVTAYRPDGGAEVLGVGDELDGGEVAPGFRLAVADVFAVAGKGDAGD